MRTQFETLEAFATRVEELDRQKQDYVVPASRVRMIGNSSFEMDGIGGTYGLTDYANTQVAEKLHIPKAYYDACKGIPGLLDLNVNAWLRERKDDKMMVRTYPNTARAVVSDRFRTIDNLFVLSCLIPVLHTLKGEIEIHSSNLTERKMYLEISSKTVKAEVKPGDVIRAGIIISNSEVGAGAVNIASLFWRLICLNGAVGQNILSKCHVGKRIDPEAEDIWKEDTIKAEMHSLQLRLRDAITHAFSEAVLHEQIAKYQNAVKDAITKPVATIENVTKRFAIPQTYKEALIDNMAKEGNMNRYGLSNSITFLAHDIENADSAFEMQRIGNSIIELSPSEWEVVNVA